MRRRSIPGEAEVIRPLTRAALPSQFAVYSSEE